jgi:hypothetical protein
MPYKSLKQAKYMHWAQEHGKLPKSVNLSEWDKATNFKTLPESKERFKKLKKLWMGGKC